MIMKFDEFCQELSEGGGPMTHTKIEHLKKQREAKKKKAEEEKKKKLAAMHGSRGNASSQRPS